MEGLFGAEVGIGPVKALTTGQVCHLAGVAASTLNSWVRGGLVWPSVADGVGQRVPRYWAPRDLVTAWALAALRDGGCSIEHLRSVAGWVRAGWANVGTDTVLVWNGTALVLMNADDLPVLLERARAELVHLILMPLSHWRIEAENQDLLDVPITGLRSVRAIPTGSEQLLLPIEHSSSGSRGQQRIQFSMM